MAIYFDWTKLHHDNCCCETCSARKIEFYNNILNNIKQRHSNHHVINRFQKALIDIAYDCGTLESAQKRARKELKK